MNGKTKGYIVLGAAVLALLAIGAFGFVLASSGTNLVHKAKATQPNAKQITGIVLQWGNSGALPKGVGMTAAKCGMVDTSTGKPKIIMSGTSSKYECLVRLTMGTATECDVIQFTFTPDATKPTAITGQKISPNYCA